MRKVEKDMIQALMDGAPMGAKNTTVTAPDSDGLQRVYLHGNLIATYSARENALTMTMAGWPTTTTRSRLNAIACAFGVDGFNQSRGVQWRNGEEVHDSDVVACNNVRKPSLPTWVRW